MLAKNLSSDLSNLSTTYKLQNFFKKNYAYILILFLFSIVLYFPTLTLRLTNTYDGLWQSNFYQAANWELSTGRWLWTYLDVLKAGLQIDSFNTLLSLLSFILGLTIIKEIFVHKNSLPAYLAGFIYLSSVVVGASLSYKYMAHVFGGAFLLSTLSAFIIIKGHCTLNKIIGGAFLLSCSLGLYQSYIGCTCAILLSYLIVLLYQNSSASKISLYIVTCLSTVILGVFLYKVIWSLHLELFSVELPSYKGANSISILNILKTLPANILLSYKMFFSYFSNNFFLHNILQDYTCFWLSLVAIVILFFLKIIYTIAKRKIWKHTILCICAALALPLASNVILLIAINAELIIQMTGGIALVLPLCLYIFSENELLSFKKLRGKYIFSILTSYCLILFSVLVIYGNSCMMAIDQEAMHEGRKATTAISDNILNDLIANEYFSSPKPIAFIGIPAANPYFQAGPLYHNANSYAKIGSFWTKADCMRLSWSAVFRDYSPFHLTFCDDSLYSKLILSEKVAEMPIFPENGYIQVYEDILIVKVSNTY